MTRAATQKTQPAANRHRAPYYYLTRDRTADRALSPWVQVFVEPPRMTRDAATGVAWWSAPAPQPSGFYTPADAARYFRCAMPDTELECVRVPGARGYAALETYFYDRLRERGLPTIP